MLLKIRKDFNKGDPSQRESYDYNFYVGSKCHDCSCRLSHNVSGKNRKCHLSRNQLFNENYIISEQIANEGIFLCTYKSHKAVNTFVKHQINLERRFDVLETLIRYHEVSGRRNFKNHGDQTT